MWNLKKQNNDFYLKLPIFFYSSRRQKEPLFCKFRTHTHYRSSLYVTSLNGRELQSPMMILFHREYNIIGNASIISWCITKMYALCKKCKYKKKYNKHTNCIEFYSFDTRRFSTTTTRFLQQPIQPFNIFTINNK